MSKKLEKNGLWESSRMILPQHKEQAMLMRNGSAPLTLEPPTTKEIEIMRNHIVLSFTLQVIEKKNIEIEMSSQTLKLLYSATTRLLAKNIREDVKKTKKILVEKNISVFENSKDEHAIYYRFVCRGHKDELVITKEFVRAGVSARIGGYIQSLVSILQKVSEKE
ncbi:hypothetical protein M5X11_15885 [Paenibacillus alginolyticus]|uniref:hypothetical protein n=1 Tax=Paenibacillus alginolyticus TaxID=59839 RepID=UPI0004928910|nr:hypothetical protein [Paenibacillus alginolyticus]MCY9666424.1 hypothetical protein [Paenibacillus alginolyticus]